MAPKFGLPVDEAKVAAALLLAPHLSMFALTDEGKTILRDHPVLAGWIDRREERSSMRATTWEALLARAQAAA